MKPLNVRTRISLKRLSEEIWEQVKTFYTRGLQSSSLPGCMKVIRVLTERFAIA